MQLGRTMKSSQGFTLIEVAIVFTILAALLAASIYPLTAQRESAHIASTKVQLNEIQQAIYGFAIAQDRLPCPTTPGNGGVSQPENPAAACATYHGFVPSSTLGISGSVNCDGLLLDAWGQPLRYSITNTDVGGNGAGDFIVANETSVVGIANLNPNLWICRDLTVDCAASAATDRVSSNAVAVIYSLGKPRSTSNAQEDENAGEANTGSTCGLANYAIANDTFFYAASRREIEGQEFDDILIWISPNTLYAKLLQAGQLP